MKPLSEDEAKEALKKKKKPAEADSDETMESIKRQFKTGSFMEKITNRFGKKKNDGT